MKIRADGMATDGFRLELDGDDEPSFVELGPSSGLTGVYSQDERAFSLSNIAMSAARVAQAEWHAGSVTVLITAPATLGGAEIDAIIPRGDDTKSGFIGSVGTKSFTCDEVGIATGSFKIAAGLRAEKLRYWQDANAHKRGSAKSLSLKKVRAKVGDLPLSAESLELTDVALKVTKKGLDVSAASAEARGLRIDVAGTEVAIDHLSLPQGLRYGGGSVEVADARVSAVALALGFGSGESSQGDVDTEKDDDRRFDLPPLDALQGQIDVDVNVDATVPVLGVRKATHSFRIPVQDGHINFKEVERSLAALEDAVLDFEVEPGRLILEKDLPLVPFDNVTLVYWPLDAEDQALAERKRVRLRKLLEWRIPVELTKDKGDKKKESSVGLRRLGIENIDVDLSVGRSELPLGSSGKVVLGGEGVAGIEKLQVDGSIRYAPGESASPSALAIEATALAASSLEMMVGGRALRANTVAAGGIAGGKVSFEGFRPTGATLTVKDVRIEGACLGGPSDDG